MVGGRGLAELVLRPGEGEVSDRVFTLEPSWVVGQIAAQIGSFNFLCYRRYKNEFSRCRDARANYKHLFSVSSDLPLGLCEPATRGYWHFSASVQLPC